MDIQSSGSFHVKSSDNSRKFNVPSQKWLKFGVYNYIYQILLYLGTSMAWDIAHWRLLIQSYFLPTWRLATSLDLSDTRIRISSDSRGSSELKTYIWIDFGMENLKITLRICGNVTFKSYEVDCVYVAQSLKC